MEKISRRRKKRKRRGWGSTRIEKERVEKRKGKVEVMRSTE